MKEVSPKVRLVARPELDWEAMADWLVEIGGEGWIENFDPDELPNPGEALIEFAGRSCYRSFVEGINPNVTRVRKDRESYFENILKSGHGSVLEHANYSFLFTNISRVATHEIVRHRAGTAMSQESMRFVRLDDLPFWTPDWAKEDEELHHRNQSVLSVLESHQDWMAKHFRLDEQPTDCPSCEGRGYHVRHTSERNQDEYHEDCGKCGATGKVGGVPFAEKKHKTSFMRRFAPDGVATMMLWTGNIRAIRHVITMRTDTAAEEEIRIIFDQVARIMKREVPLLMQDMERDEDGFWKPIYRKV